VTELSKVVSGSISGQNSSNAFVSGCGTNLYAVTHDGKAYATGRNHTGQLADGTTTNSNTWKHISSLTNVVDIGGGSSCIAACQSDGTVYAWGDNNSGQLGQGNTTTSYTPLQVKGVGGSGYLTNISAVGGGANTMFYITSAGALYACGNGGDGQLGQGNTSNSSTPLQVKGVGGTGYLTNIIKAEGANADNSVIVLSSTGTVYTWGWNGSGQAGLANTTEYHTPQIMQDTTGSSDLTNIVDIASTGGGWNIMLSSLVSGGHVYGAGFNGNGQLGDNSTSNRSTVVQMKGVGGTGFMENIVDVDAGGHFTIMCDSSGYVYCVGYGGSGALGQGNTSNSSTPLKVKGVGGTGYLENIIKVHADDLSSLALSSTGKLYGWGRNNYGNLGDGTETERHTPVEIPLTLFTSSPSVTYDGKNKLTVGGTNYADTSTVTYYSNTYNIGTAKTMYVKDAGEYVFKINGTDKYADSNVYVSSVDLAGATTKPIDFDGYNKLTLIDAGANAVSNVKYFSNTYEMGSASTFYIKDTGTYDLEMSGSNVFALSSNTVPGIVSGLTVPAAMTANSSGGNTASSSVSSANAWKVFDGSDNTNYSSPEYYHWDSPHQYTGSSSLGGVDGTWIKIQLASAITPTSVFVKAKPDNQAPEYAGRPQQWRIMGSTDNANWTQLHSSTTLVDSSSGTTESFTNTTAYTYLAIVVTHKNTISGGGGNDGWQISRLSFTSADTGGISEPAVSGTHRFPLEDGTITDENDNSQTFSSGGTFEAGVLRKDGKTSLKVTPGINKNFTLPTAMPNWCVSMWVFIPYITSYGSSNSNDIPSDFSSYMTTFGWNWHAIFTYHMNNGKEFQMRTHHNWILHEKSSGSASSDTNTFEWRVNSSIGSNSRQTIHGGNNSDN
jgi:alpha-tubulin suppressor-like RCC1 family protein